VRVEISSLQNRATPPGRARERVYAHRRPDESVLYGVVQAELEGFLAQAQARERPVPRFVERELRAFLACGILAHGFVRVRCDACASERLVAFACKGRGFCPSCGGRRMADTAAHLVDRVLPQVLVRQWVLSLPFSRTGSQTPPPYDAYPFLDAGSRVTRAPAGALPQACRRAARAAVSPK
jgi:hypothetical protein